MDASDPIVFGPKTFLEYTMEASGLIYFGPKTFLEYTMETSGAKSALESVCVDDRRHDYLMDASGTKSALESVCIDDCYHIDKKPCLDSLQSEPVSTASVVSSPTSLDDEEERAEEENPDRGVPPMSQIQFGEHTLDLEYRISMPPFYTVNEVIATFLGKNDDHPGYAEWLEMKSEETATNSSDEDSDWKQDGDSSDGDESSYYSCESGDASDGESSDVPEVDESDDESDNESDNDKDDEEEGGNGTIVIDLTE
jgi:hypothetical protein